MLFLFLFPQFSQKQKVMKYPKHLVKNQMLYQFNALDDCNLLIVLQRIILLGLTIRKGQALGGSVWRGHAGPGPS